MRRAIAQHRQWSVSMAFGNVEYGAGRKFAIARRFRFPDPVGLLAIAAAPAVVLFFLVPLPLVPPVLSLLSLVMACGVALYARITKASRDGHGATIWNISYGFAFIWIVAAKMSDPKHVLDWFDTLSMLP
jgi:hypothetical protein